MTIRAIEPISGQDAAAHAALLGLNNANAHHTSSLTAERWDELVARAFSATCVEEAAALLIAFDQNADYDSANFLWFRQRLPRFVYVDRIIVSARNRAQGLASRIYEDLFSRARATGHDRVVCEVNLIPANPKSDRFHDRMGFSEVGQARLEHVGRTVRYLERHL
ncbi:MAG: GNAT family N-acetyltransferase [Hyphomicrobiales bacterium]|nr:GNAT family N-acetyltransferase [Hyphomicrobiales bacterium]